MSDKKNVDDKIVSMQFDNAAFEKNIHKSILSLETLKKSLKLDDAANSFNKLRDSTKNISIDGLNTGLEVANKNLVSLVAQATLVHNAVDRIANAGINMMKSLTINQVNSGFNEYELKMGSIQTIMASTGADLAEVNEYLQELNLYSDKTIYSFADMTNNIGKFTNAGVGLKDAVAAIKGVSNEAAVSGATAVEAARAMYNFAQALSAGYVKLIDWKSIENANMATVEFKNELLKSAEAAGTVKKNADGMYEVLSKNNMGSTMGEAISATRNFNDSLSYQWMTTEVLIDTLNKYSDETTEIGKKATEAATKVKTWSMLMDTLKEAVGSGWAMTFELILGDFERAKDMFTDLSDYFGGLIGEVSDARNSILSDALSDRFDELTTKIEATGISMEDFEKAAFSVGKKRGLFDENIKSVDDLNDTFGSFRESLGNGWLTKDVFSETLNSMITTSSDAEKSLTDLEKVALRVIRGEFGEGEDQVNALTKAGYNYSQVQAQVNEMLEKMGDKEAALSDAELKTNGYTELQIEALREVAKQAEDANRPISEVIESLNKPAGRDLLIDTVKNGWANLVTIFRAARDAWNETFSAFTGSDLYDVIARLHDMSEAFKMDEEDADKLRRTFKGLFAVLDIFKTVTGTIAKAGLKVLSALLGGVGDDVLSVTAVLGDLVSRLRDFLLSGNSFTDTVLSMATSLGNMIRSGKEWLRNNVDLTSVIHGLWSVLQNLWHILCVVVDELGIVPAVQKLGSNALQNFASALAWLNSKLSTVGTNVKSFLEKLKDVNSVSDLLDLLSTSFQKLIDKISENLGWFGTGFDSAKGKIKGFSEDGQGFLQNLIDKFKLAKDKISETIEKIKGLVPSDFFSQIFAIGMGASIMLLAKNLSKLFSTVWGGFTNVNQVIENLSGVLIGFKGVLKAYSKDIKANALLTFAKAVLVLVVALGALTLLVKVSGTDLYTALGILTGIIVAMSVLSLALGKMKLGAGVSIGAVALMVTAISGGLLSLMLVLKKFKGDKFSDYGAALGVMAIMLGELVAAMLLITNLSGKAMPAAIGILALAVAMKILVNALIELASVDWSSMSLTNVVGMVGSLAVLVVLMGVLGSIGGNALMAGVGLLAVVVAMKFLCNVITSFMDLDLSGMDEGHIALLVGVVVAIGALFVAMDAIGPNALKGGVAMLAVAAAMGIMIGVIEKISDLVDEGANIWAGVGVLAALTVFIGAIMIVSDAVGDNALKGAVLVAALSASVLILVSCITLLGKLDTGSLIAGTAALSVAMGMMALLVLSASKATGNVQVVIAIIAAIGALTIALGALSMVPTDKLFGATLALGAVMGMAALLVSMSQYATGAVPVLGTLIGMVAVLGVVLAGLAAIDGGSGSSLMAAGALALGLLVLTGAIVVLAAAASALAPAAPAIAVFGAAMIPLATGCLMLGASLALVALALAAIAPVVEKGMGAWISAIDALISKLSEWVPKMASAIATGIVVFCQTIADGAKSITEAVVEILSAILSALDEWIPELIELVKNTLVLLLEAIREVFPELVQTALDLIVAFLSGIAEHLPYIIQAGTDIICAFISGIADSAVDIVNAAYDAMITFVNGLADAIRDNQPVLDDAIDNLIDAIFDVIAGRASDAWQAGKDLINGFIDGIKKVKDDAVAAAKDLGDSILGKIKDVFDIHSPSREMREVGKFVDLGFAEGIKTFANRVVTSAGSMGDRVLDTMRDALSSTSNFIQNGVNTDMTIRPVLDLSNVEAGANSIGQMFSNQYTLGVNANGVAMMMNRNPVVATNDDVVDALGKLQKQIGGISANNYTIEGITYDDGSNIAAAVNTLVRAARVERRR